MSNMSYCRFKNTMVDLLDCQEHLSDDPDLLDEYEKRSRKRLIDICIEIAEEFTE